MLVRVRVVGDGTSNNPFRAPLPNYTEVLTLQDQGVVYALIPDTEHPDLGSHPSAKVERTGHGAALIGLDAQGHGDWYAHIDHRYQERKGEFRPEVA